jgi:hypothetical protein
MLPRRYFSTSSADSTSNIIRNRDKFNTKIIDSNDVAGASVVKDVINTQDGIITRLDFLESAAGGSTTDIGTVEEFELAVDDNK